MGGGFDCGKLLRKCNGGRLYEAGLAAVWL